MGIFFWTVVFLVIIVTFIEVLVMVLSGLQNNFLDSDESELESPFRLPGTLFLLGRIFDWEREYGLIANGIVTSVIYIVLFSPIDSVFLSFLLFVLLFLIVTYRLGIARLAGAIVLVCTWFVCLLFMPEE